MAHIVGDVVLNWTRQKRSVEDMLHRAFENQLYKVWRWKALRRRHRRRQHVHTLSVRDARPLDTLRQTHRTVGTNLILDRAAHADTDTVIAV